jgi:hypothetical protein
MQNLILCGVIVVCLGGAASAQCPGGQCQMPLKPVAAAVEATKSVVNYAANRSGAVVAKACGVCKSGPVRKILAGLRRR